MILQYVKRISVTECYINIADLLHLLVPGAGVEPARDLTPEGFSY